MKKSSKSEKEFAKNLFGGNESLYDEKACGKTKEKSEAEEAERKKQEAIEKNL